MNRSPSLAGLRDPAALAQLRADDKSCTASCGKKSRPCCVRRNDQPPRGSPAGGSHCR